MIKAWHFYGYNSEYTSNANLPIKKVFLQDLFSQELFRYWTIKVITDSFFWCSSVISFRLFRNSVFFCTVWKKVFSKFFSQTSFFERSVLRNIESAHFFLRAGGGADGGAREPESLTFDEVAPDYAEMALLHQTSKRVESEKAEYNVKSVLSLDTLNGPRGQTSHSAQWKLNAGVTQDVRHWNEI